MFKILATKETQIKTILKFTSTQLELAKSTKEQMLGKMWGKRTFTYYGRCID